MLQSDIQQLKKYETKIDDEIQGGPVQFVPAVSEIYKKRLPETELIYNEILSKPFDFTISESVVTDPKKINFPSSEEERKEVWRKRLKYLTLQRYSDLVDAKESNKGKEGFVVKTDQALEQEAREKVKASMDRTFERYRTKFDNDEKFSVFVNTITGMMDYDERATPRGGPT